MAAFVMADWFASGEELVTHALKGRIVKQDRDRMDNFFMGFSSGM